MKAARYAVLALLLRLEPAAAQEPFAVRASETDLAPVLSVGPVLAEETLTEALEAGLPLRMRFRVELWRDELLDDLVEDAEFVIVVRYEPLERHYEVFDTRDPGGTRFHGSYSRLRAALETQYGAAITPRRSGRYYYLASLEMETLALTDLEELEGWLRGELTPAVGGQGSVLGAIGTGAKRLFIRVLGLPARTMEARSPAFRIR